MRKVMMVLVALLSMSVHAAEGEQEKLLNGIDAMKKIPAPEFHVVESNGRMLVMSVNGRYVIAPAKMVDIWNQMEITSVADMERSAARIPYKKVGINPEKLGSYSIGTGPEVMVWVDIQGKDTKQLLTQINKLKSKYRFHLIFLPATDKRRSANRALVCDETLAKRVVDNVDLINISAPNDTCGREKMQRNAITAALLNVKKVPLTIAGNGVTMIGISDKYTAFLQENRE